MRDSEQFKLIDDQGSGRAFIVLYDSVSDQKLAHEILQNLSKKGRVIILSIDKFDDYRWEDLTNELINKIEALKIRQASIVGIAASGTLALNLCLLNPKLIRSLVLINAATRAYPNLKQRIFDWLEAHLPMGLPFRAKSRTFDGKPFLQRVRCPVLVLSNNLASQFILNECKIMNQRIPTSWYLVFNDSLELANLIQDFQEVPAKCPQKGKRLAA